MIIILRVLMWIFALIATLALSVAFAKVSPVLACVTLSGAAMSGLCWYALPDDDGGVE